MKRPTSSTWEPSSGRRRRHLSDTPAGIAFATSQMPQNKTWSVAIPLLDFRRFCIDLRGSERTLLVHRVHSLQNGEPLANFVRVAELDPCRSLAGAHDVPICAVSRSGRYGPRSSDRSGSRSGALRAETASQKSLRRIPSRATCEFLILRSSVSANVFGRLSLEVFR